MSTLSKSSRTAPEMLADLDKMIYGCYGPYFVDRSRLAYLVSKEEWGILNAYMERFTYGQTIYASVTERSINGIRIVKREEI